MELRIGATERMYKDLYESCTSEDRAGVQSLMQQDVAALSNDRGLSVNYLATLRTRRVQVHYGVVCKGDL